MVSCTGYLAKSTDRDYNKTLEDRKSRCGYTAFPAKGVDHECCVVVAKTGCVIDGKICMSQRKIVKSVIAVEKNWYPMDT